MPTLSRIDGRMFATGASCATAMAGGKRMIIRIVRIAGFMEHRRVRGARWRVASRTERMAVLPVGHPAIPVSPPGRSPPEREFARIGARDRPSSMRSARSSPALWLLLWPDQPAEAHRVTVQVAGADP